MVRQHLRDEEHLVAPPLDRLGHDEFGLAIHLGGVDMAHPEIEAPPQGGDGVGPVCLVEVPRALSDDGDGASGLPEGCLPHADLPFE